MLVRGWQRRLRDRRAVVGAHHAFGEKEIAKKRGDEEVLAEELLKYVSWEAVPGDGVRHRREDPIQLAFDVSHVIRRSRRASFTLLCEVMASL